MATLIIRNKTHKQWEEENPILKDVEFVYEKDTGRFKVGDGITPYKELKYFVDPCIPFVYIDIIKQKNILRIISVISFILTIFLWAGLSCIDSRIGDMKFIWQFTFCGIIYLVFSILLEICVKGLKQWKN